MDKLGYPDEGLKSRLTGLTDNQKYQLLKMLQQELVQKFGVEYLFGNKEAILNDLKENHVQIKENEEMFGYKGKIVHLDLPAVGGFKGFKFDYFVSESSVRKNEFEKDLNLEERSYSMDDIGRLLGAVNEYMKEFGVEAAEIKNQNGYFKYWIRGNFNFNARNYLKELLGLNKQYRLSDKNIAGKGSRITWDCSYDDCSFDSYIREYNRNYLFLKLS